MNENFGEKHLFQDSVPGEGGGGGEPSKTESSLKGVWQFPDPSLAHSRSFAHPEGWVPSVQVEQLIPNIKPELEQVSSQKFEKMETDRADVLIESIEEPSFHEFLRPYKDQIVVDLGAGQRPLGHLIAAAGEAKAYIAVEPNHYDHLKERLLGGGGYHTSEHHLPNTPSAVVKSDALSFLKRLPDESVSIFVSGLDDYIITDDKYIEEVEREIARVLNPHGAFISWDSVFRIHGEDFDTQIGAPERMFLSADYRLKKTTKKKK